jgi:hypothetical protein
VDGNMRNNNGADEFMLVEFSLRVDGAGSEFILGEWNSNFADNHQHFGGTTLITPTPGSHTIEFRWRRITGAGTATFDSNDYYSVRVLEMGIG